MSHDGEVPVYEEEMLKRTVTLRQRAMTEKGQAYQIELLRRQRVLNHRSKDKYVTFPKC